MTCRCQIHFFSFQLLRKMIPDPSQNCYRFFFFFNLWKQSSCPNYAPYCWICCKTGYLSLDLWIPGLNSKARLGVTVMSLCQEWVEETALLLNVSKAMFPPLIPICQQTRFSVTSMIRLLRFRETQANSTHSQSIGML